jgi:hypothetical protein
MQNENGIYNKRLNNFLKYYMNSIYNVLHVSIICTCQNLKTTYSIMFTFIGNP